MTKTILSVRFRCAGREIMTGEITGVLLGNLAGDLIYVVRCVAGVIHIVPASRMVEIHPAMTVDGTHVCC